MRYTPTDITSTYAAIAPLNANFDDIAALLEKCVFTDGTPPNAMQANFDMNHFAVKNLADAVDNTDAVTLRQLTTLLNGLNTTNTASLLFVDPRTFGAKGDGVTDDTSAVLAAGNYAFATGRPLDGGDAVYATTGVQFDSKTRPHIRKLRLKQLSPTNTSKTLYLTNCDHIRIEWVEVDLGTTKNVGVMNSSGGIWIDGGSGHNVLYAEAYGNGMNSLIAIWNTSRSIYANLYAHDGEYDNTSAIDDVMQGINLQNNTQCSVLAPRVYNLFGNANVSYPKRFTRGITLGGNVRVTLVSPEVQDVDQGIDVTGSAGNLRCSVLGGSAYQCTTVGLKFADSAVGCLASGFISMRCTLGFLATGPSQSGYTNKTSFIDFVGCKAIDCGALGFPSTVAGYMVQASAGGFDISFPKGIRFISCSAIDTQTVKTMTYGFYNNVSIGAGGDTDNHANTVSPDCIVEGATTEQIHNFHRYICRLNGTTTQSIPNGSPAQILWDNEVEDTVNMHDLTTNKDRVVVPTAGVYRVRSKLTYTSNSTGFRRISLLKNGTLVTANPFTAVTGDSTVCTMNEIIQLAAGDYITIQADQNSGGSLNVNVAVSFLDVELLRRV